MPLYEFKCKVCSHVFERKQSYEEFDRTPAVLCPECGDEAGRKINACSFQFSVFLKELREGRML